MDWGEVRYFKGVDQIEKYHLFSVIVWLTDDKCSFYLSHYTNHLLAEITLYLNYSVDKKLQDQSH